jgi:hypothetical protein
MLFCNRYCRLAMRCSAKVLSAGIDCRLCLRKMKTLMFKFIPAFTVATLLFQALPAFAYDDTAVAVCEYSRFQGQMPSWYERVDEEIKGVTVRLRYERSPLNTKPKTEEFECSFELRDGKFEVAATYPAEVLQCEDISRKLASEGLDVDQRVALQSQADACGKIYEQVTLRSMKWRETIGEPLSEMGVYPIDPADTALSQE